jgi:hypothetical protein
MSHPVKTHKPEKHDDLPESIANFRKTISMFKKKVFEQLESPALKGKMSAHDISKFNEATKHIKQFGNILMEILNGTHVSDKYTDVFRENNVDLTNLSKEEKDLCKYYIDNDINIYTFDINRHSSN